MRTKTYMIATLLSGVAFASPAFAQATNTPPPANPQAQPELNAAPTDQTPAQQENVADTPAQDRQDTQRGAAETIVVTGSRIVSPNITSLAPVQVVGEQDIDKSGAVNIQEVLLENPAFGSPALSTTNSAFLTSGAGTATVDLRDLGSNRTLVLINNRRVVGGLAGSPIVDLNTIPTQFIERVDILTGGASSLYGSDAVAGVVNFILKRNFEGLLMEGQYGITQHGDWPRYQISATAGANVADGRGNIMVHLGYSDDKGLLSRERKNTRVDDFDSMYLLGGPTYDPKLFGASFEPYFSSFPPQGRFTAGGVNFTYGNTGQLQPCFTTNGPTCTGGPIPGRRHRPERLQPPVLPHAVDAGEAVAVRRTGPLRHHRQHHLHYRKRPTPRRSPSRRSSRSRWTRAAPAASSRRVGGVWDIQSVAGGACNPLVPAIICTTATDTNGNGLKDIAFRKRLTDFGTRNLRSEPHLLPCGCRLRRQAVQRPLELGHQLQLRSH